MDKTYIYGIRDLEIGKFIYVGKSNDPEHRYGKIGNSHNDCVRELVEQKGEDSFQIEELEEVQFKASEDWIKREKFWKLKLESEGHPLCNQNDGGGGVTEVTEETRTKISKSKMGHKPTEETRAKMSKTHKGILQSEEAKCKNRETHLEYYKTHDSPMKGKRQTEKSKAKTSAALMGHEVSQETRDKIGTKSAKAYPSFYNIKTKEYIPMGHNLRKLCADHGLNYTSMWHLKKRITNQSKDGWQLTVVVGI